MSFHFVVPFVFRPLPYLLRELEVLDDKSGMKVLNNVYNLESQTTFNLVVRAWTIWFWKICIGIVDAGDRVCAMGTPGIGNKSMMAFLLIRMLLHDKKHVIYICRSHQNVSWFYEFQLIEGGQIVVQVYPEANGRLYR
jgi:hypothetical protein